MLPKIFISIHNMTDFPNCFLWFILLYVPWTGEDIIEFPYGITVLVLSEEFDVGAITSFCYGTEINRQVGTLS